MDQDTINFLARCLLCATAPNKHLPNTHVGIFSPAGMAQKLMDKIGMHLPGVQIEEGMPQQVCKACIGKLNYCTTFENSSRKAREMLCKIKPKPMKSVTIKTEPKEYEETTYCQRPEAVFIQETDINTKPNVQDIKMEIFDEEVEIKTDPDFYPAPEDIIRTEQVVNKPNTSHTAITSSNMAEFDLTRCGICKLHFSRYNLAWHIKKKHRSLCIPDELGDQNSHSTQCDICEKIFPKQKLWNHLKLTHKLGWIRREGHVVKCPLCPLEVSVPGILFHLNYCHGIQCKSTGAVENGMMSLEKLSAQLAPPAQNVAQHNAPTKQKIASHIKIQVRNESKTPDESLSKEKEEEFTMVYCVICERFMAETSFWFHMKAMHDLGWLEKDGDVIKCPLCPVKFEEKEVLTHLESCHDIQIKPGLKNKSMTLRELRLQCAPKPPVPLKPDAPSPWVNCVHCKVAIENMPHRMEYHITIKHPGGKELLCSICDENFLHTGMEQPHMYSKNKKKCPHYKCFRVFNTTEEMEFHVEHDHKKNIVPIKPKPVRTITVPYTPKKVYANKKALRLLGDQVQCDICLQIIRNADRLITHKNSRHGMNLKFHCDICGKGYPTARTVRRHKQRVHFEKKTCPVCGEQLNNGVFWRHVKAHAKKKSKARRRQYVGYRPYNPVYCSICQMKFNNKYLIIKHLNEKHLDVVKKSLEYWCDYCNKGPYSGYSNVVLHIMSHHVPKLTCAFCGVHRFRQRLIEHMRRCHKEIFRPMRKVVKKKLEIAQWVQC